jgi:hypothetical protein
MQRWYTAQRLHAIRAEAVPGMFDLFGGEPSGVSESADEWADLVACGEIEAVTALNLMARSYA